MSPLTDTQRKALLVDGEMGHSFSNHRGGHGTTVQMVDYEEIFYCEGSMMAQ